MAISEIVSVNISVQDSFPTAQGFGTPLIIDSHVIQGPNIVKTYSSTREMISDGFTGASMAVLMAKAIFSQNPSVERVKVARLDSNLTARNPTAFTLQILDDTFQVSNLGDKFEIEVIGLNFESSQLVSYTVDNPINTAGFYAGELATLLDALPGITASESTNIITITADSSDRTFGIIPRHFDKFGNEKTTFNAPGSASGNSFVLIETTDYTGYTGFSDIFDDIVEEDDDFYCLLSTFQHPFALKELSGKVIDTETPKIYIASNSENNILTGNGVLGSVTNSLADSERVMFITNKKSYQFPDAAMAGVALPSDPGSITWAYKTFSGVESGNFTTQDKSILLQKANVSKYGNIYENIAGLSLTRDGLTTLSSQRYMDITRGIDWLTSRLQERIFAVLVQAKKIPYTDAGAAIIENEVRAQLQLGIDQGVIAADPAPVVTVPKVASIPAATRASRLFPGVTFTAQVQGAIQKVTIEGSVNP